MALDAEAIWSALEDRLRERTSKFSLITRRRVAQLGLEQLPCLMVLDDSGNETPITDRDAPAPVWALTGELGIICRPHDEDQAPTATLNDLIKDVREALERTDSDPIGALGWGPGYVQHYTNLGGLVRVLAISKVEKGAGELTGTAVAQISIEMEAL